MADTTNLAQDLAKIDADWIARRISMRMRWQKITVTALAEKADVSESTITKLLTDPGKVTLQSALAVLSALSQQIEIKDERGY